jgi:hypothetical protein
VKPQVRGAVAACAARSSLSPRRRSPQTVRTSLVEAVRNGVELVEEQVAVTIQSVRVAPACPSIRRTPLIDPPEGDRE